MRARRLVLPGSLRAYLPVLLLLSLQLAVYPVPVGVWLLGVLLGLLAALVALGLALVQRANRVLNFAQADLGALPTALAYGLIVFWGVPYLLAGLVGLVAAAVIGALVEFLLVRRFFRAPRLVLTVATIGISQLFLVGALLVPRLWGETIMGPEGISFPGAFEVSIDPVVFNSGAIAAAVLSVLCIVGLATFLGRSEIGVAVRASAERSDRAAMLGVPVKRLNTLVWSMTAVLSFVGVFMRATILGLPVSPTMSLAALVMALTALVLGGSDNLPAVALSSVALGVLEQGVLWHSSDHPAMVYVVFAGVVLVGLVIQRSGRRRVDLDATVSWRAADDPRGVPSELAALPEVRAVRALLVAVGLALLVVLGFWLGPADQLKASAVACTCLVTLSVVVLTGWAGQVSLGQMSFAAVGAVAGSVATVSWGWDLSLVLVFAGAAGALAATVVGLPAVRLRGPYLAVASLAFALATTGYLLNRNTFDWIPRDRIERPRIFGAIDLASQRSMYAVCVCTTLLALVAVHNIRRSRTGRVLRAVRGNERAAQAYGVRTVRAKLAAFALSGCLASVGGCLLVILTQQYSETPYTADQSVAVFTAAVVGGVGSIGGAVVGALFSKGGTWFLSSSWQLLPSAAGVLGVLLLLPGGLADFGLRARDGLLRKVAARRGIEVPSLIADRRVTEPSVQLDAGLREDGVA